jgi:tRNA (mo5U34)-methyltransferase
MPTPSYQALYDLIAETDLAPWLETMPTRIDDAIQGTNNGHLPKWLDALDALPDVEPSHFNQQNGAVTIGQKNDLSAEQQSALHETLMAFHPWRKGPWNFFGIDIDTEWRSDWKWDRIQKAISPLKDRLVLDIGSGNGYYSCRMAAEGAKLALGTDPYLLYVMQSFIARRYLPQNHPAWVIPFGIEQLPPSLPVFDTVFSMGVLYHRRSPLDHLIELREMLRPGGELVLETLVVEGEEGHALLPRGRYAKMRNTWFIPSCLTLERWLERCGFKSIRLANLADTTTAEQRSTDWMTFDSLETFLDPNDPSKTIEGYPGPRRALFVAEVQM